MKKLLVLGLAAVTFLYSHFAVSAAGLADVFSAEYYADTYEDLKVAFDYEETLLFNHFLTCGLSEKRIMSPVLDVVAYRERYADLDLAFGDNWDAYVEHWFAFGINEGRDDGTDFNPKLYVESYGDIKLAYGYEWKGVIEHYLTWGIQEGRDGGIEKPVIVVPVENATVVSMPMENPVANVVKLTDTQYDTAGNPVRETYTNSDGSVAYYMEYIYDESGTLIQENKTDANGEPMLTVSYKVDGSKASETVYDEYSRLTTTFCEDGSVKEKAEYTKEGNLISFLRYYSNGNVEIEHRYDGSMNYIISETCYYEDGSLRSCYENYPGTEVTKTSSQYREGGILLVYTEYYESGMIKRIVEYHENGKKSLEVTYDDAGTELTRRAWDGDGNEIAED